MADDGNVPGGYCDADVEQLHTYRDMGTHV